VTEMEIIIQPVCTLFIKRYGQYGKTLIIFPSVLISNRTIDRIRKASFLANIEGFAAAGSLEVM